MKDGNENQTCGISCVKIFTFHHSPTCPASNDVHESAEEEESPEARVATLTASLATLAAEKSRTESAMQV